MPQRGRACRGTAARRIIPLPRLAPVVSISPSQQSAAKSMRRTRGVARASHERGHGGGSGIARVSLCAPALCVLCMCCGRLAGLLATPAAREHRLGNLRARGQVRNHVCCPARAPARRLRPPCRDCATHRRLDGLQGARACARRRCARWPARVGCVGGCGGAAADGMRSWVGGAACSAVVARVARARGRGRCRRTDAGRTGACVRCDLVPLSRRLAEFGRQVAAFSARGEQGRRLTKAFGTWSKGR